MGDNTGISWCDATANAIVGCTDEGEACRNCFARDLSATRLKHLPRYKGLAVITEKGRSQWTGEVRLNEDALEQVMTWRRPRKVFLTTMGDPCHESLSDETMAQFFAVTLAAPQHVHQVLTKRPKRMREFFERVSVADLCEVARGMVSRSKGAVVKGTKKSYDAWLDLLRERAHEKTIPNLWCGTSVGNQDAAERFIPEITRVTVAGVRFLSCEPLIGPVDLDPSFCDYCGLTEDMLRENGTLGESGDGTPWCLECDSELCGSGWCLDPCANRNTGIQQVIVGGESGRKARPMHPKWAESLLKQCKDNSVAAWFKQWGEWYPVADLEDATLKEGDVWCSIEAHKGAAGNVRPWDGPRGDESDDVLMRKVGRGVSGELFYGELIQQFPEVEP